MSLSFGGCVRVGRLCHTFTLGVITMNHKYRPAWNDLRRRKNWLWLIELIGYGFVAFVFLFARKWPALWVLALMSLWVIAALVVTLHLKNFLCPRCGQRFLSQISSLWFFRKWSLTSQLENMKQPLHCSSCGLRIWAKPEEEE